MHSRRTDAKPLSVGPELLYIPFSDFGDRGALLVGFFNELVVDIGKILNEADGIAAPLKIAAQHVENAERTGVSYVYEIVNGRSAGIYFDFVFINRYKLFLCSCKRVINLHFYYSFSASLASVPSVSFVSASNFFVSSFTLKLSAHSCCDTGSGTCI